MTRRAVLVALLCLACDGGAAPADAAVDGATDAAVVPAARAWLRDEAGGAVVLRGTNVEGASKWAEGFLPPAYETEADFAPLRVELGMNAVRFLVFWEAVEPAPGDYDLDYLAAVRARIEAAGAAGLQVVVDMHQDVFGRGFGHDGAPRWACDEALYASFTPPDEWFLGYFEPEVQACFDRLWLDADTRGAFAAMWGVVADALRGAEVLFAYELLNEPHWGTSPLRAFERDVAPAAYAEWIGAIRAADPDPWILMGPASAANVGLSSNLRPPDAPRVAYAPHVYPAGLEQGDGWSGDAETVADYTDTIRDDAARMGLPAVITEVGARADVDGALAFLELAYDAFDREGLSVTQWEGGPSGPSGYGVWTESGDVSPIGRAVARPHPARTRGTPIAWSWDAAAGVFTLEWEEDDGVSGDTRVTVPTVAFPDGADASVEDGGAARIEGDWLIVEPGEGARRLTLRRR